MERGKEGGLQRSVCAIDGEGVLTRFEVEVVRILR